MKASNTFAQALIELDMILTGHSKEDAETMARQQEHIANDPIEFIFMSDAYYLSDCGYSRVFADVETGELKLSSVSLQKVKDKWHTPEAQVVRAVVQSILNEAYGK